MNDEEYKREVNRLVEEAREHAKHTMRHLNKPVEPTPGDPEVWEAVREYTGSLKNSVKLVNQDDG